MSKKTLYITLGVIAFLVVALMLMSKAGLVGGKNKGKLVDTAVVETRTIIETVSATGKIQPEIEIKISSEVSGEIIEMPVKEGQLVKKGDLLVRVNPDLYTSGLNRSVASLSNAKASLSQAEAQLKEAQFNYDRSKTLFEKGIISKAEWDNAVARFETAKASREASYYMVQSAGATVNEASDNLRRTTIYAPVDGTISLLAAELGERVVGTQQMTGTEIMRVANLNNMEVEVDVNENDIVKLNIGDEANIEVDAYLKKEFKGVVTSISNSASAALSADQVTNFKVKIKILKASYEDLLEGKPENYSPFRPGMTATVDIITKKKVDVVAVPISAVVVKSDTTAVKSGRKTESTTESKTDKKMECVFVTSDNKAKIKVITTGIQDDTYIEVLEGLKAGETIITGPYSLVTRDLNSGDEIQIPEEKDKKTPLKEK